MTTERQAWKRLDKLERQAWLGASPFEDDSPAKQAVRWVRGWVDIGWWFRTYLGHYFTQESPDFHLELIDICDNERFAAVAAPRGHAKSTVITFAHSLWELAFRKFWYLQIISTTKDSAAEFVGGIKDELEDNDHFRRDFGDLTDRGNTWNDAQFITSGEQVTVPVFADEEIAEALTYDDRVALAALFDCDLNQVVEHVQRVLRDEFGPALARRGTSQVAAFGRGQKKIRGRRHGPHRPDRIKCDDIEDDEQAANNDTTDKVISWFKGAVMGGLAPLTDPSPGRLFLVGTVLATYTLLTELLDKGKFKRFAKKKFSAINTDPDTGNETALWEARWTLAELYEMREDMGEAEFGKEYLSEAPDETGKPFPTSLKDYTYFDDPDLEGRTLTKPTVWCDPALGRNSKSDSPALLVEQWDELNGVLFIHHADETIRRPEETCKEIIRLMIEFDLIGEAARFEDVGFQELMQPLLEKIAKEEGVHGIFGTGFPVPDGDKDTRIMSISHPVRRGKIRFKSTPEMKPSVRQFVRQPKGRKDVPDLTATAYLNHARTGTQRFAYRGGGREMSFGAGAY